MGLTKTSPSSTSTTWPTMDSGSVGWVSWWAFFSRGEGGEDIFVTNLQQQVSRKRDSKRGRDMRKRRCRRLSAPQSNSTSLTRKSVNEQTYLVRNERYIIAGWLRRELRAASHPCPGMIQQEEADMAER